MLDGEHKASNRTRIHMHKQGVATMWGWQPSEDLTRSRIKSTSLHVAPECSIDRQNPCVVYEAPKGRHPGTYRPEDTKCPLFEPI